MWTASEARPWCVNSSILLKHLRVHCRLDCVSPKGNFFAETQSELVVPEHQRTRRKTTQNGIGAYRTDKKMTPGTGHRDRTQFTWEWIVFTKAKKQKNPHISYYQNL